jgi:hypothetical protein
MSDNILKMEKKAQLQIMENVFMLLIVFVILAIALVFVMMMQKAAQKDKLEEYKELDMIKKSQILSFLPEMQCSDNNNLDPDCFDIYKIDVFTEHLKRDKLYYPNLLGNIKIEIVEFDPSPEIPDDKRIIRTWVVYDNPKPDVKGEKNLQFPVLLKDVVENSNHFGVIKLGVYE